MGVVSSKCSLAMSVDSSVYDKCDHTVRSNNLCSTFIIHGDWIHRSGNQKEKAVIKADSPIKVDTSSSSVFQVQCNEFVMHKIAKNDQRGQGGGVNRYRKLGYLETFRGL